MADLPDPDKLRAIIRAEVIAALERLRHSAPPAGKSAPGPPATTATAPRRIVLLFCGNQLPPDDFFSHAATLAKQGFQLDVVLSRTFEQHFDATSVGGRLAGATLHSQIKEPQIQQVISSAAAIVAPALCTNTAAKVAAGIDDSVTSIAVLSALRRGIPVFVSMDIAEISPALLKIYPAMPPALQRTYENAYHRLQQMGIQFAAPAKLISSVSAQFEVPKNETPERLARTKPSQKRQFITVEDISNALARGSKEVTHSRSAYITDEARDYAAARGVTLREE